VTPYSGLNVGRADVKDSVKCHYISSDIRILAAYAVTKSLQNSLNCMYQEEPKLQHQSIRHRLLATLHSHSGSIATVTAGLHVYNVIHIHNVIHTRDVIVVV